MPFFPNGTGQSTGNESFATCEPLLTTGAMYYVHHTGSDAYAGTDTAPFATLAAAVGAASANDIIVLKDGHTETVAATTISAAGVVVVGGGSSGGLPTVKLTAPAGAVGLTISGAGVQLRNIWFEDRAAADVSESPTVSVSGAAFECVGCYFQGGQYDVSSLLQLASGADRARIASCTFISVGTALDAIADTGLRVSAAISDLTLEGVTFSNGSYGWADPGQAMIATAAAITRLRGLEVSLLLGADVGLHASTTGFLNVATATGGSHVAWTGV